MVQDGVGTSEEGEKHCCFKVVLILGHVPPKVGPCYGTHVLVVILDPGAGRDSPAPWTPLLHPWTLETVQSLVHKARSCEPGVSQLHFLRADLSLFPWMWRKKKRKKSRNELLKCRVWGSLFLLAGFTSCCLYFLSAPSLFCTILKTTLQDDPWAPTTF
jgi:hypothetical protein